MRHRTHSATRSLVGVCGLLSLAAGAAADAPDPAEELLRLDSFIVPIREDAGTFWAFTPGAAVVVEARQEHARNVDGSGYDGEIATFSATSRGWMLGTTEGIWEIRLNESDLRYLPELESEGVYRFYGDLAFTAERVFHIDRPYERYEFDGFDFEELNDVFGNTDTTFIATDEGLRRLVLEQRTLDDEHVGRDARKDHVVRFVPPETHNLIDQPDSSLVRTRPLLVGERRIYYEDPGSREWIRIDGVDFRDFRSDVADSAYLHVDQLLFQDLTKRQASSDRWRRWLVCPTGVARLELPDGGVPHQSTSVRLEGDVRDTYVDSIFVWVATTEDLYVIDREFDNVDRFIDVDGMFVWGFLDVPVEFTSNVQGEDRGWYALSREGMTEVFSESWEWDAYGFDRFTIEEVTCFAPDVDGFWVGTRRGLRWFDAQKREWVPSRVPVELREVRIHKMEWVGSDLYALSAAGIHTSTRLSRSWSQVARP